MRRNSLAFYYCKTDKCAPSIASIECRNFVQWKHVTQYDKKSPIHYVKAAVRTASPASYIDVLARIARKTGLNMKGGALKKVPIIRKPD